MILRSSLPGVISGLCLLAIPVGPAASEPRQYCVTCKDPDQTYICQVDSGQATPTDEGMRLFCIIRTSKDGGHRTCAVNTNSIAGCSGTVRTYSFKAPEIPQDVRETMRRHRETPDTNQDPQGLPPQKGGEPETLIDLTGRAVGASREGIKNSGEAVGGAARVTKKTVGKAARGMGKAAGKVGQATKKTGSAVGNAAKTAYDCLTSLFKDCGSSQ